MSMPDPTLEPNLHRPVPDAGPPWTTPGPPQFVEIPGARRKQKLRLCALLTFPLVIVVAAVVVPLAVQDTAPAAKITVLAGLGAIFGAAALAVVLVLAGAGAYLRGKQSAAAALRPGAAAFITQRTPELAAALHAIGIGQPRLGMQPAVTVGAQGIELWARRRAVMPSVTVPWGDIAYVHPCHFVISNGRRTFPVMTLQVLHKASGHLVEMPLPIGSRNGLNFARSASANALLNVIARYTRIG